MILTNEAVDKRNIEQMECPECGCGTMIPVDEGEGVLLVKCDSCGCVGFQETKDL